jgi:type IV pilus assembly protein PilQ
MPFLKFNKKNYRITLAISVLTLFLLVGCMARKTENLNSSQTNEVPTTSDATADAAVLSAAVAEQKVIHGIEIRKIDKTIEILIKGNQELTYTSIKQSFPFAICVYLLETKINPGVVPGEIVADAIGGLKLSYADQLETTVKLEIPLNRDIPYEVREEGAQLRLILSLEQPLDRDTLTPKEMTTVSEKRVAKVAELSSDRPLVIPDTPAIMTDIKFQTVESGRSDIRVETSHPIRYEMIQKSGHLLNLKLYNTKVTSIHQRPLLTRYFNSAVERVEAKSMPDSFQDCLVEMTIREQVPYRIIQEQNTITLVFEPSQIEPPLVVKARELSNGMDAKPNSNAINLPDNNAPPKQEAVEQKTETLLPGESLPKYKGEKIKLDFYDTDIKNVFRILRSVSGLNFAIDKDVQGKVTMTLENPVPWDQVLDLVLKMNNLGKKNEGNVIRIATIATLQNEEKILQDAIASKKKSLEQKESFEPLVTQYIPINYSDAQADISPHLTQMLSKRGKISVDQRTNMIILTDTQTKVDQALEIINRLDTVTPQIMIEARVVEVTKEFARNIGVSWNLSNATDVVSTFVDDFNVSVNKPTGGGLKTDFSFFRLFGSSVTALNAQLEASEEQGDVRIISSPRILTLDNKKAKIKQGQEIAYLERDDSGGSSVSFKNVDLLLEVTPHVTPDKRISMTLYITKNDVAGTTADGVPYLATNEVETELLVNNNDTVVIGGIVKTTKKDGTSGLPFLSGLPILGPLFGVNAKEDDRNELLIFLTPSIVQLEQKRNTKRSVKQ